MGAVSIDTETTGVSFYDRPFLVSAASDNWSTVWADTQFDLCSEEINTYDKWVMHNAKFDLQKLLYEGLIVRDDITPDRIEDTECLAALLYPHRPKRLKSLARELLGEETDEAQAVSVAKRELQKQYKQKHGVHLPAADIGYHMLPPDVVIPYAIKDAEYTWALWRLLKPRLDEGLLKLYNREMELTLVLLDIEAAGIRLDLDYIEREIKHLNDDILRCELRIQDATGLRVWYPEKPSQKTPEGAINPNSGVQIREAYAANGVELADTKESTLAAVGDELSEAILDLRGKKKLLHTYLENMRDDQRDGIIHPHYRQHEPKTGRMSSASNTGD